MEDWKLAGGGASVGCGGSHVPPMFRWWIRIGRRTMAGVPSESLAQFLWANSDYALGRGHPPEGTVEVPLLPRQGALDEKLVQFLARMTTASFDIATLVRASF
uniref:Uncharacterized protein n=1 Tax=Oryza meridionalis TaxID=40149 RepID=A0A0E0FE57_9ORYZ